MQDIEVELLQADCLNGKLLGENELLRLQLKSKEEHLNELQRSLIHLQIDPREAQRKKCSQENPKIDRLHKWSIATGFFVGVMLGKKTRKYVAHK